jgi:hypothetical protein
MSQTYTEEWVRENVHDMVCCERARARRIIQREDDNFKMFLERLSPEERSHPIAQAFIAQMNLRMECLGSRFPNLEWVAR